MLLVQQLALILVFGWLVFFLIAGYFLLRQEKCDILCWIINNYFNQYFTKILVPEKDVLLELSMNHAKVEFVNLGLNCETLNSIVHGQEGPYLFKAVSFGRFTLKTDFTNVTWNLEDPEISVSLRWAQCTSPKKQSPGIFAYLLTASVALTAVVLLSPILTPVISIGAVALVPALIGCAGAVVAAILYTPKIQRWGVHKALHYWGKPYLRYFQGKSLSLDQIELDIWNGWAKLMNIVLDKEALWDVGSLAYRNSIKVKVIDVRMQSISCVVPWWNFSLANSKVTLTQVSIKVQPKYEKDLKCEGYKKIMLRLCSAFVTLVQTVYPTNVINAIQTQLRSLAEEGRIFVEPEVNFKMNRGIMMLVAETIKKRIEIPETNYLASQFQPQLQLQPQPQRRLREIRMAQTVSEQPLRVARNVLTNLWDMLTVRQENREVLYNYN